jgi:predicted deacetylase
MRPRYLFRLDDITPTMNQAVFDECLQIFMARGIKPILGVVPENHDPALVVSPAAPRFWDLIRSLVSENKITLAQHGLHHIYHRSSQSLLFKYGIGSLSEFSGLQHDIQRNLIIRGQEILKEQGLETDIWMAPNHSYDENTLKALVEAQFRYVTDGIGLYPFRRNNLFFVPVISGKPRYIPCGMTTICLHPNTMTSVDIERLNSFFSNRPHMISFEEAVNSHPPASALLINTCTRLTIFLIKKILYIIKVLIRFLHNKRT